ncbi:GDSL-type esterase/lipase family protein [uncultured Muribaculum sp.]|uniref:GDSL-type esterase/lipase family protein n=1 Tax=uncultured Muribaculum sp. TaxID=1918613 RepID=UPI0025D17FB7|nr:GDSL-type esterase/lipase family protein [uncultured Muribaculum sp.]
MKLHDGSDRASYILLVALAIIFVISLLPLNRLTGGALRDFSLFDDIVAERYRVPTEEIETDEAPVDSALTAMQRELEEEEATVRRSVANDTTALVSASAAFSDSAVAEEVASREIPAPIDPMRDGYVAIEDYTAGGSGMVRLRAAFSQSRSRCVRLAFVGDSYIEGDIFTQDVRSLLQTSFGGSGVGYVNMYSEFPGFRRSVRQSGGGWSVSVAGHKGFKRSYAWLSEQYSTPKSGETATARYAGTEKVAHAATWSRSVLAFWAPEGGSVKVRSNGGRWDVHDVAPGEGISTVTVDSASTKSFEVGIPSGMGITALGVWLDAHTGVAVDCMSSRGFSGVTLRDVSPQVCRQLTDAGLGYDLIVLEFGINAMSASQTDYTSYGKLMTKVVDHIHQCYPDAVVMLMGIGDRGQKRGADVRSMPAAVAMIAAQRDVARNTGCLFWDTRQAMGGDGAIVAWANASPPRANKDYIHLNHHGGSVLAAEFVKSLRHALED